MLNVEPKQDIVALCHDDDFTFLQVCTQLST